MVNFMTCEEENGHTFKKKKLKYIVSTPITDGPHETPELLDEGIPFLSAESVKNGILDFNYKRGYISLSDHKLFCKKVRPQKNDIFIVKSGATTGNCGIVTTDEEFSIWSPLALIRCDNIYVLQKFIYYYSLCYSFTHQVEQSWSYGTQQNIGMGVLGNLYVTLPSSKEQQSIVDYLDKECAQIDSIVADLEKQIELLQQYKKSLITETVTKGLDKSVPMKDSGVEWIGKIPDHWDAKRMKYFLSVSSGDAITNEQLEDGEYPVYGGGKQMGYFNRTNVDKNKILIGRVGANCGCVTITDVPSWATDNALVVQTYCHFKYIYYILISADLNRLNEANAQPLITGAKVGNCVVSFTKNYAEQEEIARYLDEHCEKIENIIAGKQEQLETIRQHKKSLIYEYVTGKKRVKEVQ